MERVSWRARTHADHIRNWITSESHLSWNRWQSCQAHDSFGKRRISWVKESCEFHRGEMSSRNTGKPPSFTAHTHTFGCSCESFAHSHSPHPDSAPQVAQAHASESLPLCQALKPFLALKQHRRRWKERLDCHPQPMLSAHPTLHVLRAPFSN